jgi:type IV pilus assembly protein PilV
MNAPLQNRSPGHATQKGVMLIEALIGLLIFMLGILALIGMQGIAMQYTIDAKYRSEASFLANQIIGTMWVDRANLGAYDTSGSGTTARTAWISSVQETLPGATGANAPSIAVVGRQTTVTVSWQRPGDTAPSRHQAVAVINDAL